jgi:hypothetical protein
MSLNIVFFILLLTSSMALKFIFKPKDSKKIRPAEEILSNTAVAVTETSSLRLNYDVPVSTRPSNPFDSMVFAGLTKDRKGGYANIEKLTDFCVENDCKVLIGSPDKIQRRMTKTSKLAVAVSSEVLFLHSDPAEGNKKNDRTTKLSHLRNNLLAKLRTEPLLNRANNIAVVDLDGVIQFNNDTLSAIKKALELPGWDGLSFYSEQYYDMWALRCTAETPNCYQRNSFKACIDKTKHDWSCLSKAKSLGDSSMLEIASAFNGINLYKAKAVEDCLYDGTDETNGMDCEHVAFNKCISAKGKKFVMAGPDMQIQTKWEGGSYN